MHIHRQWMYQRVYIGEIIAGIFGFDDTLPWNRSDHISLLSLSLCSSLSLSLCACIGTNRLYVPKSLSFFLLLFAHTKWFSLLFAHYPNWIIWMGCVRMWVIIMGVIVPHPHTHTDCHHQFCFFFSFFFFCSPIVSFSLLCCDDIFLMHILSMPLVCSRTVENLSTD